MRQGCPFSGFGFPLGVQPFYEAAIRDKPNCHAVSIQDDLTLVGPQEQVFAAFDYIQQHAADFQLTLRINKCAVYIPDDQVPKATRALIEQNCSARQLRHANSLETLGVLIGREEDVIAHAEAAVDSHEELFACLEHPAMPVQDALLLLRYCALPRLS